MQLFHDYTFTWWQVGMLKIALLAIGIIFGAAWPAFWKKTGIYWLLWIIVVVAIVFLMVVLWPQIVNTK